MSKHFYLNTATKAVFLMVLPASSYCFGQDIDAVISIKASMPPVAVVTGTFSGRAGSTARRNLSMRREYGGIAGLGERVLSLSLRDGSGHPVQFKRFMPGEFLAETDFTAWEYDLDLSPLEPSAVAAHTSWVSASEGMIFLDDLLPLVPRRDAPVSARVRLVLPDGWTASGGATTIETSDVGRIAFFIGKDHREQIAQIGSFPVRITSSGDWKFSDEELAGFVREIYTEYKKIFGKDPSRDANVFLLHFPIGTKSGEWEADTRGSTVTIVSSDMPFRTQSLQRLHEQLRHELFHLWLPNAVNLTGNYDWFYEGFALYQSLKIAVAMNRLRFEDFLDTLASAHTIDSFQTQRRSLIDASENRIRGSDTQIYARGLIVAFLADLSIIQSFGGKKDVSSVTRSIFEKHSSPAATADGNSAVLEALGPAQVAGYVTGNGPIDWRNELKAAGIDSIEQNSTTTLRVVSKPNARQRRMLERLGYNNWRKLSANPK